jgi:hypothetical protein
LLLHWMHIGDRWSDDRDSRLAESMKADFERLTIARLVW